MKESNVFVATVRTVYEIMIEYSIVKKKNCEEVDSLDNFFYENLYRDSMKNLNCTVPWVPNKDHICTENKTAHQALDIHEKQMELLADQEQSM